ncbi:HpcH/HpaI aldolase/citrate lyase family protein [Methyloversatilis thermotolerans]|uniref:HpcH/HpaI aldolase/citrate lyase family protein n=1 Tax=Methyloversatilis thermotolerans TaxID=1346290 RepID=UPI0003665DE9|nr:CoA ester lyase [Methyloversatilis thermotolerans]
MPDLTYLFVPGHRPDRYAKALASGADAVILDLEDAVADADKAAARTAAASWLQRDGRAVLRINAEGTPHFADDVALLHLPGVSALMLPKAESPDSLRRLHAQYPSLPLLPLIETARGLAEVARIAEAPGVERLVFGSIDLQLDLGMSCADEELDALRVPLVLASRLAGLAAPVDGVCVALDDEARLERETLRARRLGFGAKLCIHPRQLPTVARCLRPDEQALRWAREVLVADANAAGAAVRLNGQMIDRPLVARARAVLAAAGVEARHGSD